ncbi:hypothetical protein SAMN05216326_1336 [Nitrosomonas marina]|uniref:Uncharacterized protein n=1 Tax=Nitrosomonas marina TaxID=917 RepID=A0A1I0F4Q9_9PROT|nr:hypothetical protein [Nitrosomonas marina]SET52386.1 hypothetical protein SAMN05216326_1336 [Nitrosomonas marina]
MQILHGWLAEVALEIEWFANLGNAQPRHSYKNALRDFMTFTGIKKNRKNSEKSLAATSSPDAMSWLVVILAV